MCHLNNMSFYADTYIITTYYLNDKSVTCIFSYINHLACWDPSMHTTLRIHLCKGLKMTLM